MISAIAAARPNWLFTVAMSLSMRYAGTVEVMASERQTSASSSLSWCESRTATAYSSWKPPPPTGQRIGSASAASPSAAAACAASRAAGQKS